MKQTNFFEALKENHKFFVEKSRSYVGIDKKIGEGMVKFGYTLKAKLYYPIAYCKFMWNCMNDWWESKKYRVKEDMICPMTKQHCDDECCPVGSFCNLRCSEISGCAEPTS